MYLKQKSMHAKSGLRTGHSDTHIKHDISEKVVHILCCILCACSSIFSSFWHISCKYHI